MEIAKVTSKGQITIPVAIREFLQLKQGDKVFFTIENGKNDENRTVRICNASSLDFNQGGIVKKE